MNILKTFKARKFFVDAGGTADRNHMKKVIPWGSPMKCQTMNMNPVAAGRVQAGSSKRMNSQRIMSAMAGVLLLFGAAAQTATAQTITPPMEIPIPNDQDTGAADDLDGLNEVDEPGYRGVGSTEPRVEHVAINKDGVIGTAGYFDTFRDDATSQHVNFHNTDITSAMTTFVDDANNYGTSVVIDIDDTADGSFISTNGFQIWHTDVNGVKTTLSTRSGGARTDLLAHPTNPTLAYYNDGSDL